jgi:HemY protein
VRRVFAYALVALLLGVGVVALIETDPGYILMAYGDYTLETSLWVGLLLLGLFTLLVYLVVRLLRRLLAGQHSLAGWFSDRKSRQSARLTNRGLINFIEGNWNKARRQLLRGATHSDAPLLNYLVAARASHRVGELDKVREYLGAAEATDSQAGIAVELTQAEMRLEAGQYEQALATLVRARRNAGRHPYVLDLLCKAYRGLGDWQALSDLLPELRKYKVMPEDELAGLESEVQVRLLQASAAAEDPGASLQRHWQSLPANFKRDPGLLHTYVELLVDAGAAAAAEKVILRALKQQWDATLVDLYGRVEGDDPGKQLANAEAWLSEHPEDPDLLRCLGRLATREQLWSHARDYFERSAAARPSAETYAELGRLLAAMGDAKASAGCFNQALALVSTPLPALPMPEKPLPRSHRLSNQG